MRAILTVIIIAAASCGGMYEQQQVDFTNDGRNLHCYGHNDASEYRSGNDIAFTCIWHCACYKGTCGQYVSLTWWSWSGRPWKLETEYVSSGICY